MLLTLSGQARYLLYQSQIDYDKIAATSNKLSDFVNKMKYKFIMAKESSHHSTIGSA